MEVKGIHKADLRLYKSTDVADAFAKENLGDWDTLQGAVDVQGDKSHEALLKTKSKNYKTKEDGTYEIYVIPGTYDLLVDVPAYLDCVYVSRTLAEGDDLDLGKYKMMAGDMDKSGLINIKDLAIAGNVYGAGASDGNYNKDYDFDQDGVIGIKELAYLGNNYLKSREVIK